MKKQLIDKIEDITAKIAVVGLGYVGLPFILEKAKVGFSTLGFDVSEQRVNAVNAAENYIPDVSDDELKTYVAEGKIAATTDFSRLSECDVIVIAVPTPLTKNLTPNLDYITASTETIAKYLRPGQFISLESTTYPGTTEEVMLPILESSGLVAEQDFFVAYSPERVDPGNKRYSTKNTNKVVGGIGPESQQVAIAMYSKTIDHVVPVSSAKAAELVKVFENTYRAVNIALVNELAMLCERMEISVWEVLDAAFTKPFGIQAFYPGPGVGGHCIPLDPHYLEWKAKEFNFNTRFIGLAGEINRRMPEYVRDRTLHLLRKLHVDKDQPKILLMGMAYKKDLGDWRESPGLDLFKLLIKEDLVVDFHDPHVPELAGYNKTNTAISEQNIQDYDLVIVVTDHSKFDYPWLAQHAKHIFDTRNATKALTNKFDNITLL